MYAHMRNLRIGFINILISYFSFIDPAAGSSTDWAYAGAKIKYSFAIELRDTGRQGFMLSNSQIIPTAEENFAGIRAIVKIIQEEYQIRSEGGEAGVPAPSADS